MEQPKQNPFELVNYGKNTMVPRVLLNPERSEDLEAYVNGWNAQKKSPNELLAPKWDKTDIRNSGDWYNTGAVKYWASREEPNAGGDAHPQIELDVLMQRMRDNPDLIPHDAWEPKEDNNLPQG